MLKVAMNREARAPLIVHLTTVPMTLEFLRGQTRHMCRNGFRALYVSSPGSRFATLAQEEGVGWAEVPMERRITPLADVVAIVRLVALFRRVRPQVVHAHTPKAGLLGMLAGLAARVPVRIYHLHGFPALTATGLRKSLLIFADRAACAAAHRVNCVSASVRNLCVDAGLCQESKLCIHENGTINGIDVGGRFDPARAGAEEPALRARLGIPAAAPVVGFVGRLVGDKGIGDLLEAWMEVRSKLPAAHLLLLGSYEAHDPLPPGVRDAIEHDASIHHVDHVPDPSAYYALMALLVLPSYREGFPYVPMEAAAMGRPVVTTRVCGCVDAVVDGETGTLVDAADPAGLASAILGYLRDERLRERHGAAGRARVLEKFLPGPIWDAQLRQYQELLAGTRGR